MSSQSFGNDPKQAPSHQPLLPTTKPRNPSFHARMLVGLRTAASWARRGSPSEFLGPTPMPTQKRSATIYGPLSLTWPEPIATPNSTTGLMESENASGSIIFQSHTCTEMMYSAYPAFFGSGGKCRKNTDLSSYLQPLSPLVYRTQQLQSLRLGFGT